MGTKNFLFTLDLPDGWSDRTVFLMMGPDEGGMQHILNIVIDPEAGNANLYDYATERIEEALLSFPGAEILKEEERKLPDGRDMYECVYKTISPDSKVVFTKRVYLIQDGCGYMFSAGFTKKTLKTRGVQMEAMIQSFRPVSPQGNDD